MTQSQLSEASGISRQTISAIERGKGGGMKSETLFAIARALDVSLDRIFFKPSV